LKLVKELASLLELMKRDARISALQFSGLDAATAEVIAARSEFSLVGAFNATM